MSKASSTAGLAKWHAYVKTHDHAALWDLLHPDAVFESPVVHTPQRGRDITFKYLCGADKVLGGPTFAYRGEWRSQTGAVLEFESEIDGIAINGVDIITFDDEGRITHFKVMVRPLKAINLLHRLMGEELMRQDSAASAVKSQPPPRSFLSRATERFKLCPGISTDRSAAIASTMQ